MRAPLLPHTLALVIVLLATLALAAAEPSSEPHRINLPIELDRRFLGELLESQVYTDQEKTLRVWDDGSGCNHMFLSDPVVEGADFGRVLVRSMGEARIGTAVGDETCLNAIDWEGTVDLLLEPEVSKDGATIRFPVIDSNLYDRDGSKSLSVGVLWDWVKERAHPRMASWAVDLKGPVGEVREILPEFLPSDDARRAARLLETVKLDDPRGTDVGLAATIRLEIPPGVPPPDHPEPEPSLSPEELAAVEQSLDELDGFVTFIVKYASADTRSARIRAELLDVLLEERYLLLEALAAPDRGGPDPVRPLFLRTWSRLAPVLRQLGNELPGEAALRYLGFIAAADALQAIDQLGPSSGLDVSAQGLRRLARMFAPAAIEDPLAHGTEVDPVLRDSFGFGPPLPLPPEPPPGSATPEPSDTPQASPTQSSAPSQASPPQPSPDPPPEESSGIISWLVSTAHAASSPEDLATRLNGWAPTRKDASEYLPLAGELLRETATRTASKDVQQQFRDVFRWLALATAWQESCWRQYVKKGGKTQPIRSPAGAVGVMQVNERVWRGFYDVNALRRDIGYNASAGAEILSKYMQRYGVEKKEHVHTGNVHNLARVTYAVYNGGPSHRGRYRKASTSPSLKAIDRAFWEKYGRIRKGEELAVLDCYTD